MQLQPVTDQRKHLLPPAKASPPIYSSFSLTPITMAAPAVQHKQHNLLTKDTYSTHSTTTGLARFTRLAHSATTFSFPSLFSHIHANGSATVTKLPQISTDKITTPL